MMFCVSGRLLHDALTWWVLGKCSKWSHLSDQIDCKNLNRSDGHLKSSHNRSRKTKENCKEFRPVGRNTTQNIFGYVLVDDSSLTNGFDEGSKTIIEKNDLSRFFGYIGSCFSHCYSDICLFECRCVIYAVTRHCDDSSEFFA